MNICILTCITFLFGVGLVNACGENDIEFQDTCISKSCLNNYFKRLQFYPQYNTKDELQGIEISVDKTDIEKIYKVIFLFSDLYGDQLLNNSQSCVNYQINSIKYPQFAIRDNQSLNSLYEYNNDLKVAKINIEIDLTNCMKFSISNQNKWQCSLEFSFNILQFRISSFIVSFNVFQQTSMRYPTYKLEKPQYYLLNLCAFDQQSNHKCIQRNLVESKIELCQDQQCTLVYDTPLSQITVDQILYLKFSIIDGKSIINDISISIWIQSIDMSIQIKNFEVIVSDVGYSIIKLHELILAQNSYIQIFCRSSEYVTAADISTGKVSISNSEDTRSILKDDIKKMQDTDTQEDKDKKKDDEPEEDDKSDKEDGYVVINVVKKTCSIENYTLYHGQCISQQCYNYVKDKKLDLNFTYEVNQEEHKGINLYTVNLEITSAQNDLFEIADCLDWRIYQTQNSHIIDSQRLYQIDSKNPTSQAQWPVIETNFKENKYKYTFVVNDRYQIINLINLSELNSRKCLSFKENTLQTWECYFEFSVILQQMTEISYYFRFRVNYDTNVVTQANPSAEFSRIVINDYCDDPNKTECQVSQKIASSLKFCPDEKCNSQSPKPYTNLIVNNNFFMKHTIDKKPFDGWIIQDFQISFQSLGFNILYANSQSQLVQQKPGYNIYKLRVPVVTSQVLIYAEGILQYPFNARLLQDNNTKSLVRTSIYTGEIHGPHEDEQQQNSNRLGFQIINTMIVIILLIC